jgi:hypothetical protein
MICKDKTLYLTTVVGSWCQHMFGLHSLNVSVLYSKHMILN